MHPGRMITKTTAFSFGSIFNSPPRISFIFFCVLIYPSTFFASTPIISSCMPTSISMFSLAAKENTFVRVRLIGVTIALKQVS